MMQQYSISCIDLLMTEIRYDMINNDNVETIGIEDIGEYCRVNFNAALFSDRAGMTKPFVPSADELKHGMVRYIQQNLPHLLEFKVEKMLQDSGHEVLRTQQYNPDLQPIESFWASGNKMRLN